MKRILLAQLLAASALAGASSAWAAPGAYEKTADGVVVTPASGPAKRVRLQVMGDRIIHVTAAPDSNLDLPTSLMVIAKPQAGGFTVAEKAGEVTLSTGKAAATWARLPTRVTMFARCSC